MSQDAKLSFKNLTPVIVDDDKIKEFESTTFSLYGIDATTATHNLLNRINMKETLNFIKENPKTLFIQVEVKDNHGQRFRGTLTQILASANEWNPPELETAEKPHGLVNILQTYFPNPKDFINQLQERFQPGHECATKQRMERVRKAIKTLINDTIESKDITRWEQAFSSPIAEKFRESIKPDPDDVVTLGVGWDIGILLEFNDLFQTNVGRLCCWKGDFVEIVVWSALQRRSPLTDLEVFAKGTSFMVAGILPERFDFSHGSPKRLEGIGTTHFFGNNNGEIHRANPGKIRAYGVRRLSQDYGYQTTYIQTKKSMLRSICDPEPAISAVSSRTTSFCR